MSYEQRLTEQINWAHPDLSNIFAERRDGAPRQRLLAVVAHLRGQAPAYFGYTDTYFTAMWQAASESDIVKAGQAMDAALQGDLYFPPHSNAFAALDIQTFHLGLNPQRATDIAQKVLERQEDWAKNLWAFGITAGVAELLRRLCVHSACRDEDLLPVLGWLCEIAPTEWASQCRWSERTLGCSGHNWWICSLQGTWMAGALIPYAKDFERFAAMLPDYLEHAVEILFTEDGWSKEGSADYHWLAAHHLFEFAYMAKRRGVAFSQAFWTKLHTIADASWKMLAPDGCLPGFADTASPPQSRVEWVQQLAAQFTLPAAKGALQTLHGSDSPSPSFLPGYGADFAKAYEGLHAQMPPLDTSLPHSGLFAMRSDWTSTGDWMAINAMPLGEVVSSHQHADLLNIEVCVRGRRVLVDNGYGDVTADDGSYKSAPEIRNDPMKRRWRVGSSAHNVATVDDEDQVPVEQIYRYGRNIHPSVQAFQSTDRFCYFHGVHDAYRRLEHPVVAHRRSIFYLRGQYWIMIDRFTVEGEATRTFQQHLHVPPGAERLSDGCVRTHGNGGNLLIVPVNGLTGDLTISPNPYPISTYVNPDHIMIEAVAASDCVLAFVLVPFKNDDIPKVTVQVQEVEADLRRLNPWEATAMSIAVHSREDLFFTQHTHWNLPWMAGDHSGTGRLYHSQCHGE